MFFSSNARLACVKISIKVYNATVLAEFCVAKFSGVKLHASKSHTVNQSLLDFTHFIGSPLCMSRLKLERYYEGFVRRGDVGTAIICRSC